MCGGSSAGGGIGGGGDDGGSVLHNPYTKWTYRYSSDEAFIDYNLRKHIHT